MQADELLITLDPPITFNSRTIDAITLKEPTAAQLEKGGKLTLGDNLSSITAFQIEMVVAVSNETRQFVSQMKISDLRKAFDYIMGFIQEVSIGDASSLT